MPPRRSQSAGRKSAPATRKSVSPRGSVRVDKPAAQSTAVIDEMRQTEAFLSGRSCRPVGSIARTSHRGWGFWAAIVAFEVLVFLWARWAFTVYVDMKARYSQ